MLDNIFFRHDLSRIIEEKDLAKSTKKCYTYDNLSRVTNRTVKNLSNVVLSEETFTYDSAGNITDAPDSCFQYDTNNRLTIFNGNSVTYDLDGNMLSRGASTLTYDSANRLTVMSTPTTPRMCESATFAPAVRIRPIHTIPPVN